MINSSEFYKKGKKETLLLLSAPCNIYQKANAMRRVHIIELF